nr:glycosyltransferase family 39 protein [Planctomycetota bacterium]
TNLVGASSQVAVGLVRALVLLMWLYTIVVTTRLGTRLFGRSAGLFAGFALAVNPTFMQYGAEPLSGCAATLAIALALEAATTRTSAATRVRAGLKTGLWLGVALLMAYKTIPLAVVVLLGLFFTGRLRERGTWIAASLVYALFGFVQCLLDKLVYGRFGASLLSYLAENIGGLLADILLRLHGLGVPGAYALAVRIYEGMSAAEPGTQVATTAETAVEVVRSATTKTWYLEHLTAEFLAWPLAAALVLGLWFALRKKPRGARLLVALLVLNFAFLSIKSAKSFRLLLPLLPAVALLAGLGLDGVRTWLTQKAGRFVARAAVFVALAVALVAGQVTLGHTNLTKYGAWWRATTALDELAETQGETWRFASAYHWAVSFRSPKSLELVKLPHHMDRWASLEPEARTATLDTLLGLDAFLAHLQILTQDPLVLARINATFEIHDILYDKQTFEELGPLYVLTRRGKGARGRTFFDLHEDAEPGPFQASIQHAHSVDFRRRQSDGPTLQLVLLGWDLETGLADGQLVWLTLHWYAGELGDHDFTIVTRLTDRDDRGLNGNHQLASGAWPTSKLEPGWILSESLAVPLPLDAELFGGADARGDLIPASFWLGITEFVVLEDGTVTQPSGLNPFQPSGMRPIQKPGEGGPRISPDGYRWSQDKLFGVAGFWLPVPRGATLRDDGKRLAEPESAGTNPEKD